MAVPRCDPDWQGRALRAAGLLVASALLVATPAVPASAQAAAPAASSSRAPAPAREDALPSARSIIDRHIAAVGGRAAILARKSTHASGTVSIPSAGMTGTIDVYAAAPDKSLLRITLGGIGQVEEGYNGAIGWTMSPMTGPALAQGTELEQKKFDSDFFADLHADANYASMTTVEKVDFDGRPCYKVRLVRRETPKAPLPAPNVDSAKPAAPADNAEYEFYDVKTGLKAGSITTRESPMGPVVGTTTETDYRRFGPLLQATTMKATAMGLEQVITLQSVEYDAVAPAIFEPPPAIKALAK